MRLVRTLWFTIYGFTILALIATGSAMNIQYDSGLHGLLFHFFLIPVLGFMYYLPHELMSSIGGGQSIHYQRLYVVVTGLLICASMDFLRYQLRRHRRKKSNDHTA